MIRLALASLALAAAAGAREPAPPPEPLLDGAHWRLDTAHGAVHVWRPPRYDRRTAGVVIYLHGWYTDVDGAWRDHKLAEQFRDSAQNALFIAPEAPSGGGEPIQWPVLEELLSTVARKLRAPLPGGPLVVAAHSGAYKVVVEWLHDARVETVLLVDALYGNEDDFGAWLDAAPSHKLVVVATRGTFKWAEPFVAARKYAAVRGELPDAIDALGRRERTARLLYIRTQIGHMELITDGKALPLLLHRTPLRRLAPPS